MPLILLIIILVLIKKNTKKIFKKVLISLLIFFTIIYVGLLPSRSGEIIAYYISLAPLFFILFFILPLTIQTYLLIKVFKKDDTK
jgi:hypothetical protein